MGMSRRDKDRSDVDTVTGSVPVDVIEPEPGWRLIDGIELWSYRELFYFLVWREIKGRYAQSVLGFGWAIMQPLMSMIVFSVIFGNLLDVASDGVPYAVFSYTALVPWVFFSQGVSGAANSLSQFRRMFTRIYFPRLIMPWSTVLAKLVDFGIASVLIFGLMAWFGIAPTVWAIATPLLVVLMLLSASGIGMWLTPLAIHYRDIRFGLNFGIQLMMYASPVVYPASMIPDEYRLVYGLNPMVGVIEGFRSALLGTNPMPWDLLATASVSTVIITITGALYFRRMERTFADVA
jgi:lipopolysaccharide transport system permease protein